MSTIAGFREMFGEEMTKREYVLRTLSDAVRKFGYSQIHIPVIEPASSFSEKVVGKSPWPEWNPNGCFYFSIDNYKDSYKDSNEEQVVLIPEGTVSVTRWLGEQLNLDNVNFPIRMFYSLNCYRNELISTLSNTKCREFSQFGIEILGSESIQSDLEILCMIVYSLNKLSISKDKIFIRLNDIAIYNLLIEESNLNEQTFIIKELLDTIAEIKAGKGIERFEKTHKELWDIINDAKLSDNIFNKWKCIIEQQHYNIDGLESVFGEKYKKHFENLKRIKDEFEKYDITICTDLCVIRSHEYYTGLSFEVDVNFNNKKYVEIAGGGRYDRLVSSFINDNVKIKEVPCTGFAFGIERVINLMQEQNLFNESQKIDSYFEFNNEHISIYPRNGSVAAYLEIFNLLINTKGTGSIKF